MGEVFRAHDPELERPVAVKVLRAGAAAGPLAEELAQARLKREAQAMARLAHPNVIAVHEVGVDDDGRVFLIMELVTGGTLRQWLEAAPRAVPAICAMFVGAGRGLAAAHAAGMVHRDFKPENVLVGADGRPRVTDFGLVGTDLGEAAAIDAPFAGPFAVALTQTGAVLGTPSYMAPEQFSGHAVTARSDQFSFCVALYEALWGRRPFEGATYRELVVAVTTSAISPPPPRPRVPARIRRAVLRGLAREPADRFASMDALLAELTRGPQARWPLAVGGVAATAAIAWAWPRGDAPVTAPPAVMPPTVDAAPAAPRALVPVAITDLGGCAEHPIFIDDTAIVFDRSFLKSQDLFTVPATGGSVRRLTSPPDFHWNPRPGAAPGDVVFIRKDVSDEAHPRSFPARRTADGTTADLPFTGAFAVEPGLVLVGDRLIYSSSTGSDVRESRGGRDASLFLLPPDRDINLLSTSRDGRWLAVDTTRTTGVCLVDLATPTAAPTCRTIKNKVTPVWLDATGARYYYAGDAGVWRFDRARNDDVLIAPDIHPASAITVSPDDRTLVYSDCMRRTRLLDVSGGHPVEVTGGRIDDVRAGPGDRIAYRRATSGANVLAMRDRDGTTRDLTSPALGAPGMPAWDAEGRRIVFTVAALGLYVLDTAPGAGPPRRISDQASDLRPVFLLDGRIAFNRFDAAQHPSIWIMGADGSAPTRALDRQMLIEDLDRATGELLVWSNTEHRYFWWDPVGGAVRAMHELDGLKPAAPIWFVTVAQDGSALFAATTDEVWRVPMRAPAKAHVVFTSGNDYDWLDRPVPMANGQVLVAGAYWAGELYRVDLPR
ncbi:MAG: serine/threonine-protein kinase [Deltaproteobacteria bacterium]|nr:serine/threonine-protein kinase [Deltaproteobacteria bacterium]